MKHNPKNPQWKNRDGFPVVDHFTYVLGGDGCMMEGISSEAFSLAGTFGLHKLIVLYDSNQISIEGSTDIAFTERVETRMQAFGFQTLTVENGNDTEEICRAICLAQEEKKRPSFLTVKTKIGFGCPAKEGTASAHGETLGKEHVAALRKNLGWEDEVPFEVPEEIYRHYQKLAEQGAAAEEAWKQMFADYQEQYPELSALWEQN